MEVDGGKAGAGNKHQLSDGENSNQDGSPAAEKKKRKRKRKHKKKNQTAEMSVSFVCNNNETQKNNSTEELHPNGKIVTSTPHSVVGRKVSQVDVNVKGRTNGQDVAISKMRSEDTRPGHMHFDSNSEEDVSEAASSHTQRKLADEQNDISNEAPSSNKEHTSDPKSSKALMYQSVPPVYGQSQATGEVQPVLSDRREQTVPNVKVFARGPFTNVKVFNRQKYKKNAFYPLSKEEQLATVSTNTSVILENSTGLVSGEKSAVVSDAQDVNGEVISQETEEKDYKQCAALHGPPRSGDTIAYKILEMGDNYCPALSNYKEAKVISYDPATQALELKHTHGSLGRRREGRFDLTIEDDEQILTNTTVQETSVVTWTSLVDTRLVL